MELYRREFLISRIKSGVICVRINKKKFVVHNPNVNTIFFANELYVNEYEKAVEEGLFLDHDIYDLLIANDMWSEQNEKELNEIVPGHIEYWKIELYNSILKSNTRKTVRKYLEVAKKEYSRLYTIRHCFDHMTCAGYASYVKNMYLISKCTRYKNKKVDWNKYDLNVIMNSYYNSLLDSDTIRILSRTTPWSTMWSSLKTNGRIFENINLTSEQQVLISWSNMYDKIYESPDCPPDEVIEDDDMLDGWLLIQKKRRDEERKKQEVKGATNSKIDNADDIFVLAETFEDAKKIDLLNDPRGKQVKQQRLNQIKKKGVVAEQELNDVQRKRSMMMQQAYIQQVKGK